MDPDSELSRVSSKGEAEVMSSIGHGGAFVQGNPFVEISMGEGSVSSNSDENIYHLPLSLYLAASSEPHMTSMPLTEIDAFAMLSTSGRHWL